MISQYKDISRIMSYVEEPPKKTPIAGTYDVIVCGGGPAGTTAAIRAAENGARVLLLERQGALGGTWTVGLMTWILDVKKKAGIMDKISNYLKEMGSFYGSTDKDLSFFPEDMKYVLERMVTEARVDLRYYTLVTGVIREIGCSFMDSAVKKKMSTSERNGMPFVKGVITESYSGRQAYLAPIIIDATGNGDVAALAGCKYEMGKEENGYVQPMSMLALISGVPAEGVKKYCLNYEINPGEAQQQFHNLFELHGIHLSYSMPTLIHLKGNLYSIGLNHEGSKHCNNTVEITSAVMNSRLEIMRALKILAKEDPAWKNVILVHTADQIGIREGRRIRGLYYITREDLMKGQKFADGICDVTFNVDIHESDSVGHKAWNNGGVIVQPYQIPLRALIAADVKGLILAGRLISGDFYAHASYRVGGNILSIGEAAGVLASLSLSMHMSPDKVPYQKVQELLGR